MREYPFYERHILELPEFEGVVNKAVEFFERTPVIECPPPFFRGTGVYALYYSGDFAVYSALAEVNRVVSRWPIYVGKAVPPGRRTGRTTGSGAPQLYRRLQEHMRSIESGEGLRVSDFRCRFMILEGSLVDLIVPIESALIRKYEPLWNSVVDGFGNHDPGSGRYNQSPSEWDVLHPGRSWVSKLTGELPDKEELVVKVQRHLARLRL